MSSDYRDTFVFNRDGSKHKVPIKYGTRVRDLVEVFARGIEDVSEEELEGEGDEN